jgi:hypothetical protein
MSYPLDAQQCRSGAGHYRGEARSTSELELRQDFAELALAYDELADLLRAKEIKAGRGPIVLPAMQPQQPSLSSRARTDYRPAL